MPARLSSGWEIDGCGGLHLHQHLFEAPARGCNFGHHHHHHRHQHLLHHQTGDNQSRCDSQAAFVNLQVGLKFKPGGGETQTEHRRSVRWTEGGAQSGTSASVWDLLLLLFYFVFVLCLRSASFLSYIQPLSFSSKSQVQRAHHAEREWISV